MACRKLHILILIASMSILTACIHTRGPMELRGFVKDKCSGEKIPYRKIIVEGMVRDEDQSFPVDAGQFSTDSTGNFFFTLNRIKNAYDYNFHLVGDSLYMFSSVKMELLELQNAALDLEFSLDKLVELTIKINRKCKTPAVDTLYLSLWSDRVDGRIIYPYKISKYGKIDHYFGTSNDSELRWIGGNVNSTVRARVFADKLTSLSWEIVRNGTRKEISDTITCKRDLENLVYFTY